MDREQGQTSDQRSYRRQTRRLTGLYRYSEKGRADNSVKKQERHGRRRCDPKASGDQMTEYSLIQVRLLPDLGRAVRARTNPGGEPARFRFARRLARA
jgi:hypothetical protein